MYRNYRCVASDQIRLVLLYIYMFKFISYVTDTFLCLSISSSSVSFMCLYLFDGDNIAVWWLLFPVAEDLGDVDSEKDCSCWLLSDIVLLLQLAVVTNLFSCLMKSSLGRLSSIKESPQLWYFNDNKMRPLAHLNYMSKKVQMVTHLHSCQGWWYCYFYQFKS